MNINGSFPAPIGPVRPGAVPATRPASETDKVGDTAETGSALWDVLTPEERDFFQGQAALGPLTYGPARRNAAPAPVPIGQRLDVRG
ncbi:MAG: hypothetical protein ABI679_04195 [Gemmatimonadota bacterium]